MNFEKNQPGFSSQRPELDKSQITEQAEHLLDDAKKLGTQIYNEGKDKLDELQGEFKERSDKVAQKVHEHPISSLLIAAGIGFILSNLLRR